MHRWVKCHAGAQNLGTETFMSFIKTMSTNMNNCRPKMKNWGIGEGRKPLTDDPENPFKPFAEYEEAEPRQSGAYGMRKRLDF